MKKNIKKVIVTCMVLCMTLITSLPVFAKEKETPSDFDAEEYVMAELNNWSEENGLGIVFDNVTIQPMDENIGEEEMVAAVESYVAMMKMSMNDMSVEIKEQPSITRATSTYTASVASMVPAIGWGYINQDFRASVSSSKISSVTLLGSSYDTGFTLGSWEPNYSWSDISTNKQYCQIHMKGTLNYLWDALNISLDSTFKATFQASGSKLVETTYTHWPD